MTYTRDYHNREFEAFSRAELASGGPDPQVKIIAEAITRLGGSDVEKTWRAGAFISAYTCGAAAAIWAQLGWEDSSEMISAFLRMHGEYLPTRRERRTIWGADRVKWTKNLVSWSALAARVAEWKDLAYPALYDTISKNTTYFGRYATMKVIEVLHRAGVVAAGQTDIRPIGAKYPRRTLAWLFGYDIGTIDSDRNDDMALATVNAIAEDLKLKYAIESWFDFETLLCNYRQSLRGKYPGRSHDRELAHWRKAEPYWRPETQARWIPFYEIRAQLFPHEFLGEIGGWSGARPELEAALTRRHKGVVQHDTLIKKEREHGA